MPLTAGYAARINFYHPGGGAPAWYVFKVAGEERLAGPDGAPVDCWIVTADYNGPRTSRFWVAKRGQTVLKVEAPLPDGRTLYKLLLWGAG